MTERTPIIAGNWKMHHDHYTAIQVIQKLSYQLDKTDYERVEVVVCPPFTAIESVSRAIVDTQIRLGAQNMSEHNFGAHTGEICAGMLKEFLVRYVILGHSERRQYQLEGDPLIAKKAAAAHAGRAAPGHEHQVARRLRHRTQWGRAGPGADALRGRQDERQAGGRGEDPEQDHRRTDDLPAQGKAVHRLRDGLGQ